VLSRNCAMREMSDAAQVYLRKFTECSCIVAQVTDLAAKLSTLNGQFATSVEQSVGVAQTSINRPNDSVRTMVNEVEQLKVELCQQCDRLLEIFRECAKQTEENEIIVQSMQQNSATIAEDEASTLHIPDTSRLVKPHGSCRRSKSAVTSSVQTLGGQMDGHATSREGPCFHQQPRTMKSARSRSGVVRVQPNPRRRKNANTSPEVVQSPPATATTSNTFPLTDAIMSSSQAHRCVTTYLSGTRTDIFGQYSKKSASSPVKNLNGTLSSINAVDEEVSFRPHLVSTTSVLATAARYGAAVYIACQFLFIFFMCVSSYCFSAS